MCTNGLKQATVVYMALRPNILWLPVASIVLLAAVESASASCDGGQAGAPVPRSTACCEPTGSLPSTAECTAGIDRGMGCNAETPTCCCAGCGGPTPTAAIPSSAGRTRSRPTETSSVLPSHATTQATDHARRPTAALRPMPPPERPVLRSTVLLI